MADQNKRIIYKQDNGTVVIIVPSPNEKRTIQEIAEKDVPTGKLYKILNASEISNDRTFRDAWTIDDSELTDGIGSTEGVN